MVMLMVRLSYTGFKPAFVIMLKVPDSAEEDGNAWDNKRDTGFNVMQIKDFFLI
jgi:hypothetical protein